MMRTWIAGLGAVLAASVMSPLCAQSAPTYKIGVPSESGDIVTWLTPGAGTLKVDHVVPVGIMPADIDGPHNITLAPDHKSYYISIAHGTPFGSLWRIDIATDTLIGRAPVEFYPTTISLSPDGELAFVANSDFYGDRPRENVLSIIHTPTMTKITDVPVCDMPHGVKVNHAGSKIYISCMHSDELLEMDIGTFAVTRRGNTGTGMAMAGMAGMDHGTMDHGATAQHTGMTHGPAAPAMKPGTLTTTTPAHAGSCAPTFVSVSRDDSRLYVACNDGGTMQVWDAATLTPITEVTVGHGAYNVEPSPDGKWLLVSNKKDQSASVIDVATMKVVATIPTTKKIVHGVGFSPDSKYGFVTAESIGADPGSIDMIDLATMKVVATVLLPAQPTGITIWTP